MSRPIIIPADVAVRRDLTAAAKLVLGFVAPLGTCAHSTEQLAKRTGMARAEVLRACDLLEQRGLVTREKRHGDTTILRVAS